MELLRQSAACDEPLIPSCTWLQAAVSMSDLGASVWTRSVYARELGSAARYEYKLTRLHDTDKVITFSQGNPNVNKFSHYHKPCQHVNVLGALRRCLMNQRPRLRIKCSCVIPGPKAIITSKDKTSEIPRYARSTRESPREAGRCIRSE